MLGITFKEFTAQMRGIPMGYEFNAYDGAFSPRGYYHRITVETVEYIFTKDPVPFGEYRLTEINHR